MEGEQKMLEVYVLVPVRKSFATIFMSVLSLVLALVLLLFTCVGGWTLGPFAVAFVALWYYLMFRVYKEFEYSYFDGEVRFAKVMNKSRRKAIVSYIMEEVVMIAPAGDRSIYKYEEDKSLKVKDFTSHNKLKPYYVMVIQKGGDTSLIKFEPDEKYLDAVEFKYKQKVVRSVGP